MDVDADEAPKDFFYIHIKCSYSLTTRLSCATMLRTSYIVFIRQCYQKRLISDSTKEDYEKYVKSDKVNFQINELMKTLVTKLLNEDDDGEATLLQATVSRVR